MNSDVGKGKPLTKEETKALVELIENSRILTTKTTNASNNKMKTEEWSRIAERFNATAALTPRTPAQLRLKWENLKKNARKRSTTIRMNHLQTGGGAGDYIPPDDILDRVTSFLGSTVSGFVVPFGGDRDPEGVSVVGGGDDGSGEGAIGGNAAINLDDVEFEDPTVPSSNMVSLPSSEIILDFAVEPLRTPDKPKRVTFTTPKSGKRKLQDGPKNVRDIAISEYYIFKKKCLEAKLESILLQNKKFKTGK